MFLRMRRQAIFPAITYGVSGWRIEHSLLTATDHLFRAPDHLFCASGDRGMTAGPRSLMPPSSPFNFPMILEQRALREWPERYSAEFSFGVGHTGADSDADD